MPDSTSQLKALREVMNQLRSPGGCPWDAEQSHETLLKYLLEESYEFIEAVEENDRAAMREELGDVLLHIVFQSQIASEEMGFNINNVIDDLNIKLINRHPHIFENFDDNNQIKATIRMNINGEDVISIDTSEGGQTTSRLKHIINGGE